MKFHNACSLGPQSVEEAKKVNWFRLDCLTARKLKVEGDPLKLKKWFAAQDHEWQLARKERFYSRLNSRMGAYL